jgi:hypothetical protein
LWTFESSDAKVYDLNPTDLSNFVRAVDMFKADLAAQTRTPPHYLLGQVVNASGDALKVAEAGLVSKCRRKILYFSDPWEEAMALALTATAEALASLLEEKAGAKSGGGGFDGGARERAAESRTPVEAHNDFLLRALGRTPNP